MMDHDVVAYVKGLADRVPAASGDLNAVIRRGRRRRTAARSTGLVTVGAAAAVVIATLPQAAPPLGVAATSLPDQPDPVPETTSPVSTMAVYDDEAGLCGSTFPIEVHVPDEYGDGIDGPASTAGQPGSEQMVRHWEGSETTLEVRWPADPNIWIPEPSAGNDSNVTRFTAPDDTKALPVLRGSSPGGELVSSMGGEPPIVLVNAETALGTTTFAVVGLSDFDPPCDTLQIVRYGAAPADPNDPNNNPLLAVIWGRPDLIISTIEVDTAPVAIECGAGAETNYDYPPKEGGPIDLGQTFATPEEALVGFLAQAKPSISRWGYTKMLEPDGSISFGFDGGSGYATVISVAENDGRWTVETWDSAGC